MQENIEQNNIQEKQKIDIERIPMKERNVFQVYLMGKMGVMHGETESQETWAEKYAKLVSDIIDGKNGENNAIIKPLIAEGRYEEASEYVMKILNDKIYN